ncbi:hypothetical protein AMK27_38885 [Streptomyces sp. CB02009]|nr:hypothetical protein AMK27_38885 [Streptomyces sp. CB02009]
MEDVQRLLGSDQPGEAGALFADAAAAGERLQGVRAQLWDVDAAAEGDDRAGAGEDASCLAWAASISGAAEPGWPMRSSYGKRGSSGATKPFFAERATTSPAVPARCSAAWRHRR